MKIKLRDLLNPLILNDRWVGFQGNSEYVLEDGEVRMGYWTFLDAMDIDDAHEGNHLTLDYEIDDSILVGETRWEVENDNGVLCTVQFVYNDKDVRIDKILDVLYTISNIHKKNICLDDAKSHYIHVAQGLKCTISNYPADMDIESAESIKELSKILIDEKDDLIEKFQTIMSLIEHLDCELQYLIDENK